MKPIGPLFPLLGVRPRLPLERKAAALAALHLRYERLRGRAAAFAAAATPGSPAGILSAGWPPQESEDAMPTTPLELEPPRLRGAAGPFAWAAPRTPSPAFRLEAAPDLLPADPPPAADPAPAERTSLLRLDGAPSFALSGLAHALLLLLATLITFAAQREPEAEPFLAAITMPRPAEPPRPPVAPATAPKPPPIPLPPAPVIAEIPLPKVELDPVLPEPVALPEEDAVEFTAPEPAPFDSAPEGAVQETALLGLAGLRFGSGLGESGKGPGMASGFAARKQGRKMITCIRGGGTPEAIGAVDLALEWLAAHQEPDGRWDAARWGANVSKHVHVSDVMSYDVAATGLALLAFLGAGHTEASGTRYSGNVRRGLYWLEDHQDNATGWWNCSHYSQGIASLAAAEAHGMDGSHGRMAQLAMDYLGKAQADHGGWNYYVDKVHGRRRSDTSITGWCLMALKSGRMAGLSVPGETWDRVRRYFGGMAPLNYEGAGNVWYDIKPGKGGGDVTHFSAHGPPAVTAISMLSLLFLGTEPSNPWMRDRAAYLRDDPACGVNLNNLYYLYYATLTAFQLGGDYWKAWNEKFRDPLIAAQVKEGEHRGSWAPSQCRPFGENGGRVYTTAMAAMTLEVYYRYIRIYRD